MLAVSGPPEEWNRNLDLACKILTRDAVGVFLYLLWSTLGNYVTAVLACSGPHIHDIIGISYGCLVMLDDQDSVPDIPEALESIDQPLVVSLM